MNEKHIEVEQWLDTLFAGEPHPQYEVNAVTVETLWRLRQLSQRQDHASTIIVEDWRQKAAEYADQAERLSAILSQVGLAASCLSQSGAVSLKTLVNTALMLNTKDASTTNLMLAISDMSQVAVETSEARKLENKLNAQLMAKNKAAYTKYTALDKAVSSLEEEAKHQIPELEKRAQNAAFLQSKGKEYRRHLHQLQEDFKSSGVDPAIEHAALLRKSEHLQELRTQLHPIRAKLDSYQKLPPDMSLARVKVEEMRRELESLESKLNSQIDLMHM